MLGKNFINILSEEEIKDYPHGRISEDFIKKNASSLNSKFYVCGPSSMMEAIEKQLGNLKVDKNNIVTEEF